MYARYGHVLNESTKDVEVFRAVNKYIDFNTGAEIFQVTRVYDTPGKAKAQATRVRMKKVHRNLDYDFVETWCERATEWARL